MGLRIVPLGYSVHAVATTTVLVLCCDCLKCVFSRSNYIFFLYSDGFLSLSLCLYLFCFCEHCCSLCL